MKMFTRLFAAALALGTIATTAPAAVFFSDNFDTYANQAAFEAAWPSTVPSNTPPSGTLSSARSVSAPNSVNIPTSTTTANTPRNGRTIAEPGTPSPTQQIVWSFDFFDSNAAAAPYRQSSNLQNGSAPGATNELVSMGLNNNQGSTSSGGNFYMARILGYTNTAVDPDGGPNESLTGSGIYIKLNDFANSPLRSTGWHNLKVIMSSDDGVATDYEFYVDSILAERVSNVGGAGTLRSLETFRLGSGVSSPNDANYDNFVLDVVPEPASLAVLGLGGVGLLARRRRQAQV